MKEEAISHVLEDNLQDISISMKPDRVTGLRAPTGLPHNITYFPVSEKRLLLPFLVVEAKKEDTAPGFRAIQNQTAFPIRRFLKAQYDICSVQLIGDICLVWFFAYQGEQWRLHAGTYDNVKVVIHHRKKIR